MAAEAGNNQEQPKSNRLEINKYPNRRYYDKTRSRHLTLEEIYAAIRDGYEVQVSDSRTGDDITAKVLAQIILELDPPKLDVFPVALLHRLLRANEQLVTDFTHKYFNQALMTFLDSQKKTEQYLRQAMGLQSASTPMTDWAKLMFGTFNPAAWAATASTSPPAVPPATTAGPMGETTTSDARGGSPSTAPELAGQVAELRQQITQLQKKLARERKRSKTSPTRTARKK
jgi:polyhydroxyalkanoate synthesis repressor PhaR